jgi:hypothetical protein
MLALWCYGEVMRSIFPWLVISVLILMVFVMFTYKERSGRYPDVDIPSYSNHRKVVELFSHEQYDTI